MDPFFMGAMCTGAGALLDQQREAFRMQRKLEEETRRLEYENRKAQDELHEIERQNTLLNTKNKPVNQLNQSKNDPHTILRVRYAKGEINEAEFIRISRILK